MKRWIFAGLLVGLAGCLPITEEEPVPPGFAMWGSDSGTLPPEFSYSYLVTFTEDQMVWVRYCKGYATSAPGCATVSSALSAQDYAAFTEALTPMVDGLVARPAQSSSELNIGGGSNFGQVVRDGVKFNLPSFPIEADSSRVSDVMSLLREYTPDGLIDKAEARARLL